MALTHQFQPRAERTVLPFTKNLNFSGKNRTKYYINLKEKNRIQDFKEIFESNENINYPIYIEEAIK